MITRKVSRNTLEGWGIPYNGKDGVRAEVLDIVELGEGVIANYKQMIFVAPDDGCAYSVDFAQGLAIAGPFAIAEPFIGQPAEITLTRVRSEKQVVTVTNWIPVTEEYLAGPKVPTLAQLKAKWDRNRDWDDACAATALESME